MMMEAEKASGGERSEQSRKRREGDGGRRTVNVSPVGFGVEPVKSVDRKRKEASDGQGDRDHSVGSTGSDEHLRQGRGKVSDASSSALVLFVLKTSGTHLVGKSSPGDSSRVVGLSLRRRKGRKSALPFERKGKVSEMH